MNLRNAIVSTLMLASVAAQTVWSQSSSTSSTVAPPSLAKALRLLHLPTSGHVPVAAAKSSASDAVAMGLASAKVYRFASADFPGTDSSIVFDENKSTAVAVSQLGAFTLVGGVYALFTVPGSTGTALTGINTGGEKVGYYSDIGGVSHGFLDKGGVFSNIDEAGGDTIPFDINDAGKIVGSHGSHGFHTTNGGSSFTDFDVPSATSTIAAGVNASGVIVGQYTDSTGHDHGFLLSGGAYTPINFPLATSTTAIGINDSNEIAGYFTDSAGTNHGFIYSAGAYTQVDVAGATMTELTRIKNNGHVTGVYIDSLNEMHGLAGQ